MQQKMLMFTLSVSTVKVNMTVLPHDFALISIYTHPNTQLRLTGTNLHADLVEHEASCVIKETVSLPVELHSVLLDFMKH